MKIRFTPFLGIAVGAALAQQDTSGLAPGAGSRGLRHGQLRGIASAKFFDSVNRNDARAALKVWFDALGQQKGYVLDSTVDILDSVAEIRERLESHSVELVTMGVVDYFALESSRLAVPLLTDARTSQGALYSYVLLVKPSSGTTSIAGLRGKNLLVASRSLGETGRAWLEVVLNREKPGWANVDLAKEMNPQLGQLGAIARSRPMFEGVIAVPAEPHPYQKELIDGMLTLHEDPRGRQLLMVIKTARLVRVQPGDLDSARELWRDFYRLTSSPPNRAAISGTAAVESNPAGRATERR